MLQFLVSYWIYSGKFFCFFVFLFLIQGVIMKSTIKLSIMAAVAAMSAAATTSASAACTEVTRAQFETAAKTAVNETADFGFGLPMWLTMVDEVGAVCHVYATDGTNTSIVGAGKKVSTSAWLGSRVISAQKANTANAFSINTLALSTGFITALTYEGGSLFGLQHSNPVNAAAAYGAGSSGLAFTNIIGTNLDPLKGQRPGGVNVFGGGVALYKTGAIKIGAIGASGDTSCRDHAVAYRMRIALAKNLQPNDDGLTLIAGPALPAALGQQPACGVSDPTTYDPGTTFPLPANANDFGIRPAVL